MLRHVSGCEGSVIHRARAIRRSLSVASDSRPKRAPAAEMRSGAPGATSAPGRFTSPRESRKIGRGRPRLRARAAKISAAVMDGARVNELRRREFFQFRLDGLAGGADFGESSHGLRRHAVEQRGAMSAQPGEVRCSRTALRRIDAIDEVRPAPARRRLDAVEGGHCRSRRKIFSRSVEDLEFGEGENEIARARGELCGRHADITRRRAGGLEFLRRGSGIREIDKVVRADQFWHSAELRVVCGLDAEANRESKSGADAVEIIPAGRQHDACDRLAAAEIDLDPLSDIAGCRNRAVVSVFRPDALWRRFLAFGDLLVEFSEFRSAGGAEILAEFAPARGEFVAATFEFGPATVQRWIGMVAPVRAVERGEDRLQAVILLLPRSDRTCDRGTGRNAR